MCRLALEQAATQPKRLAGAPQVGQRVSFEHKGDILTGKVARINRKSVTVSAAPGIDWRVAHDLLLEPKE
ncbi:MAG: hypothetical protein LAT68_15830 [Cyclobacteriaceae bacterium]|nr:hypothetical protein [Cyclobacteriaceae bacterium]